MFVRNVIKCIFSYDALKLLRGRRGHKLDRNMLLN